MSWIDVHTHLNMLEMPPEEALQLARDQKVENVITIGTCPDDLPVVLGLALAVPLASLTGRRSLGVALRRVGLLRIPEESNPPEVLRRASSLYRQSADAQVDSLAALLHDPDLLAAHRRMLPPARRPGIDPLNIPLVIGAARLSEATVLDAVWPTLSAAEKAAVLSDGPAIERLVILSGAQKPRSSASVAG